MGRPSRSGEIMLTLISISSSGFASLASGHSFLKHPGLVGPVLPLLCFCCWVLGSGQCCACNLALRETHKQ